MRRGSVLSSALKFSVGHISGLLGSLSVWNPDSCVVTLQVEARYCNKSGSVIEYSLSVLDEANGYFPLYGVKPDEIYMHFFPGSRVNIKWKKAQVRTSVLIIESCINLPPCAVQCQTSWAEADIVPL